MDIVTKREILEDYINHSYGKYFRYFIKNNIDFDDDSNPLVRNFKEALIKSGAQDAQSDFSSDCLNSTQACWRKSRRIWVI